MARPVCQLPSGLGTVVEVPGVVVLAVEGHSTGLHGSHPRETPRG